MKKLFTRRKEPKREQAVQLPEGGFDHPFQDSEDRSVRLYGTEHPRTVSVVSPPESLRVFDNRSIRSSSCGCVRSLITLEKDPTGGRR